MNDYQDDPLFLYDPEAEDYVASAFIPESVAEAGGRGCNHLFESDDEDGPWTCSYCGVDQLAIDSIRREIEGA